MKHDYIIIGGGVAGLCAAIRLLELGAKPLVIESGTYPSHKVCGEFFSPECIPILNQWGIHPIPVHRSCFHMNNKSDLSFTFPSPAGSLSHYTFDTLLMEKAKKLGATILTETKAVEFNHSNKEHIIKLSNGETIHGGHLIIAVGRIPQMTPTTAPIRYMGLKTHFKGVVSKNKLGMYFFEGGYIGLSPIEEDKVNVACLVKIEKVTSAGGPEAFMEQLFSNNDLLQDALGNATNLFPKWMNVGIPEFGIKSVPEWPNTYCIGDAAGTIPPITGMGLSMAVRGGLMAAEYSFRSDPNGFRREWIRTFKTPITLGKWLHAIAIRPGIGSPLLQLGKCFPKLIDKIFQFTRSTNL